MRFDLSRLKAWSDLPFFAENLPEIEARLAAETHPVFPPTDATFAALELCQPDATQVVILGQDPYHTAGKADGLAFSIPQNFGGRLDSLGNIFKELESDLHVNRQQTNLHDWASQGVLLLNTVLTVPQGHPKAHETLGWAPLIDQILLRLAGSGRVYMLWGKPAQQAAKDVSAEVNLKIETAHPSPLAAYRGFFGSRPFSRANAWLVKEGRRPISWGDPMPARR